MGIESKKNCGTQILLRALHKEDRGATMVEYAFVILTIFVTSLLGSMYFQHSAQAHYKQTTDAGPFSHDEKPLLATINADWAKK